VQAAFSKVDENFDIYSGREFTFIADRSGTIGERFTTWRIE
jgi:hypothetical protein